MSHNPKQNRSPRPKDPQIVTTSRFKEGLDANYLIFSLKLGLLELKFVAKIPDEGEENAPVYINHKLPPPGTSEIHTEGKGAYTPRTELDNAEQVKRTG